MAAVKVGGIFVDATFNAIGFKRDLTAGERALRTSSAKMNRALRVVDRGFLRMEKSIKRNLKSMVSMRGVVTTLVGGGGLGLLIKRAIDTGDSIAKTADKVGLATGELQEMRFAAEQNSIALRTTDMALQRFSRRVGEVAQGQGELLNVAKQYGVQLRDDQGRMRRNIDLLGDFADIIQNAESEQEQLRIAFKLFDSEGATFVNLMRHGAAGIEAFRARAQELGIVIDDALVRKAETAKNKIGELANVISSQWTQAVLENADAIADLSTNTIPVFNAAIQSSADVVNSAASRIRTSQSIWEKFIEVHNRLTGLTAQRERGKGVTVPIASPPGTGFTPEVRTRVPATTRRAPAGPNAQREGQIKANKKFIEGIEFQVRALGMSERALASETAVRGLNAAATRTQRERTRRLSQELFDGQQTQRLANDHTQRAVAVYQETRLPLEVYRSNIRELNTLMEAGAISTDTYSRAVAGAQQELSSTDPIISSLRSDIVAFGDDIVSAGARGEGALESLKLSFESLLQSVGNKLANRGIDKFLDLAMKYGPMIAGGFSGGSPDLASSQFAAGSGTPFAKGGQFVQGGRGGTDANFVPLQLTRGERVTVDTPQQTRRGTGGGPAVEQHFHLNMPADVAAIARQQVLELMPLIQAAARQGVEDTAARDPSFMAQARIS